MRRHNKRGERGAAMVEAAMILPVISLFFGLSIWMMSSYYEKLNQMQTARYDVAYYAAHSCDETAPAGNAGAGEGDDMDVGGVGGAKGKGGQDVAPPGEMGKSLNTKTRIAHETTDKEVNKFGYSRPVRNSSHMMCNEKHNGGGISSIFSFAKSFF